MFTIIFCKAIFILLRFLHLGGGTALPGLYIEKKSPGTLKQLLKVVDKTILITGTNGKTTTQKILREILQENGNAIISNKSGANLIRGIASVLVQNFSIFKRRKFDLGIFEVEEASMPILCKYLSPDYIIVTNFFRDQLDAYGEITKTKEYVLNAIKKSPNTKIILNYDDPHTRNLALGLKNSVYYFGLDKEYSYTIEFEDFKGKTLNVKKNLIASNITIRDDLSSNFFTTGENIQKLKLDFKSPGIQNIYNALGALSIADIFKIDTRNIKPAFQKYIPAFGRGELIKIGERNIRLLLIKNPIGFSLTLRMLKEKINSTLLIIINDNIADGRDISWLYDAKVEILNQIKPNFIGLAGSRGKDMLVRLKYSGFDLNKCKTYNSIKDGLLDTMSKTKKDHTLYILPTYTALFEVRNVISSITKIKKFYE